MTVQQTHAQAHRVRATIVRGLPNPQPTQSRYDRPTPTDAFAAGFDEKTVLLTVEETMRLLRVGRTKLYELLEARAFETIKVGGSRRIIASSLHSYLSNLLHGV